MSRIRVLEHAEFTRRFPQALASELEIRTRAGDRFVERAEYPKGHAKNPMNDADVVAKFRDLTADALSPAQADGSLDALWRLEEAPGLGSVLDLFTISR